VFSALIALDHAFILQTGPAHERLAAARTFHGGLVAGAARLGRFKPNPA
jgi:hypothetical protein